MNEFLLFGVGKSLSKKKRSAVKLLNGFNLMTIVAFLVVTVFFATTIPKYTYLPFLTVLFMFVPLVLTHYGHYNGSRYILSVLPSYIILAMSVTVKYLGVMDGVLMYLLPKIWMYALIISPITFFGLYKKKKLMIALLLVVPSLILYETIHGSFGVQLEDLHFDSEFYLFFYVLLTVFFIAIYSGILTQQSINIENIKSLRSKEKSLVANAEKLESQNATLELNAHLFNILQLTSQTKKPLKWVLTEVLKDFSSIVKLGLDGKGAVLLKNKEGNLEIKAQHNAPALEPACALVKPGQCLCGKVLVSQKNIFCNNVTHAHDIIPEGMTDHGHYVAPIMYEEEVLGVITVYIKAGVPKSDIVEDYLDAVAAILAKRIIAEKYLEKIEAQKEIVYSALKKVNDSLNYGNYLQTSMLPSQSTLNKMFKQSYYVFMPKDTVSGDFYFSYECCKYQYFGVGDCTGHGIPGAFLSAMSIETISQVTREMKGTEPHIMLDNLRDKAKMRFAINEETTRSDAMDMALCRYDKENRELLFSGGHIHLVHIRKNTLTRYNATKCPVGDYPKEIPFELQSIDVEKGDRVYLFSDGLPDQFGYCATKKRERKLSRKGAEQLLLEVQSLPFKEQKSELYKRIDDWMGDSPATDDITLLCVEIE